MKYSLNGMWDFGFTMPETGEYRQMRSAVPSNVEIPLMENGILKEIMPCDTIHATTAFDYVDDWTYTRTFDAPALPQEWDCQLVFEGIDTIADIYLNGEPVHQSLSMHMTHRVPVTGKLRPAGNTLKVVIHSAVLWARAHSDNSNMMMIASYNEWEGCQFLRKARHEMGWDNAPRLMTSGIYRDVYLETLPPERFDAVYCFTSDLTDTTVSAQVRWSYKTPAADLRAYTLRCTLSAESEAVYTAEREVPAVRGRLMIKLPRERVRLWWPRGFGEPFMHDLKIEMLKDGKVVSVYETKWGIRLMRLANTGHMVDGEGEFRFYVNHQPIHAIGTNWKPLHPLHSQADALTEKALALVDDLHCNMVRVWGGGIYESETFYRYCDAHGILVWQDFMFACEVPPADPWYLDLARAESRQVVERLRNHACIAVFCGDNENDQFMFGLNRNSNALPSHNVLSRQVLAECVRYYAPFTPYVASSPLLTDTYCHAAMRKDKSVSSAEAHCYPKILAAEQYYREKCGAMFIGETGPWGTNPHTHNPRIYEREKTRMKRLWDIALSDDVYFPDMHQSDGYFAKKRNYGAEICKAWYGRDFSFGEYHEYAFGINVACAHQFQDVVELCRTDRAHKSGVLWWSLLDMWPMIQNFSVVDCDFQKKLPYYWIRQSQQPLCLMAVRRKMNGPITLYYANDTLDAHRVRYRVSVMDQDGGKKEIATGECLAKPNSSAELMPLFDTPETQLLLMEWEIDGKHCYNHFSTADHHAPIEVWHMWVEELNRLYGAE